MVAEGAVGICYFVRMAGPVTIFVKPLRIKHLGGQLSERTGTGTLFAFTKVYIQAVAVCFL